MRVSIHLQRTSWTLLDQGVVSLGTFLLNVVLARHLPPAEYGVFAFALTTLMLGQVVNGSLIFYPMSIRSVVMHPADRPRLVGRSLVLLAMLCLPLILAAIIGLIAAGRSDLLYPLPLYVAIWQMQEALRRSLFAEFRHREALLGDTIAYFGPVATVLVLLQFRLVAVPEVFLVMSLASATALSLTYLKVGPDFRDLRALGTTMQDFWSLGRWSLANNLTSASRVQIASIGLTSLSGAAATASFQVCMNVVSLANPVLLGLCNVIPQAAAQKFGDGYGTAWQASRSYALMGAAPMLLCYGTLLLVPELVLQLLYGADSPYAGLVVPIRILAVGWLLGYGADMACAFLHGVDAARLALLINGFGAISAAALFLPLALSYGIVGACIALSISGLVRLVAAQCIVARIVGQERQPAG